jgi:hypothetical protein
MSYTHGSPWVLRRFSEKNRVYFRSDKEFIVEGVLPDLFHIIPIGDNLVFNAILQSQDSTLGL